MGRDEKAAFLPAIVDKASIIVGSNAWTLARMVWASDSPTLVVACKGLRV